MMRVIRWVLRTGAILAAVVFTLMLVRAFDARRMPDLKVWHTIQLEAEYRADRVDDVTTWAEYLALEEDLFEELDEKVIRAEEHNKGDLFNRYNPESASFPERAGRNWNRSFELTADDPRGVALLVHGLTDAPYSLREIGEILHADGLHVIAPRMPGHGTVPAGLLTVDWAEWLEVVHLASARAWQIAGAEVPVFLFGYSNGGALILKATLDRLASGAELPDGLVLFSPAVGITRFATLASWHRLLASIPYFEKFRWAEIYPEFDPYKYNSFPKIAGHQTFDLSLNVQKQMRALDEAGRLENMPPVLTFQSLVDSTVLTASIVNDLYERLPANGSELVLYDVNRFESIQALMRRRHRVLLESLIREDHPFSLTLVTNADAATKRAAARRYGPGGELLETEELGAAWPSGVYSLSHLAIPFSPKDPVYGVGMNRNLSEIIALGVIQPRGERGVLRVPVELFMRLHYNPFFDHLRARVLEEVRRGRSSGT